MYDQCCGRSSPERVRKSERACKFMDDNAVVKWCMDFKGKWLKRKVERISGFEQSGVIRKARKNTKEGRKEK